MPRRRGGSWWLSAAAVVLAAAPATAQTETTDPTLPPVVTVTPVGPEDPGTTPTDPGVVTPPVTAPTPPPPTDPATGGTAPLTPATQPASGPTTGPQPLPPPAAGTGDEPPDLPPPATDPGVEPAPLPDPAATEGVADPGWTHAGPVPVARTLREGDVYAQFPGYGGLFSIQYGINGDADVGGGLTFFTLELTAKYSFYHNDYMAISAIAEIAFPFYKSFWPMSAAGLEYMMFIGLGPLFSLWNDLAELDVGLLMIPAMQWPAEECFDDRSTPGDTTDRVCRTNAFDTDFVVMPYVYGSIALAGFARLLFGFEHFAVTALDSYSCPEGNTVDPAGVCRDSTRRVIDLEQGSADDINVPALLLGIRLHGERFVADIGLHFPMSDLWWDHPVGQYMIFIPSASFGYLW
ncbi:MAG: hypothetical protein JXB32_05860 [Deltaproteobacteria bacterium]|nr:hypothetical protein [Deltaproteobacteria bacterium]